MTWIVVLFMILVVIQGILLSWLAHEVRQHSDRIEYLFMRSFGPAQETSSGQQRARWPGTPPPAPPPAEEPSPYHLSTLPDALAAEMELDEHGSMGASSQRTCTAWGEQDERDAEFEDSYTSDLAVRIRALAGDED